MLEFFHSVFFALLLNVSAQKSFLEKIDITPFSHGPAQMDVPPDFSSCSFFFHVRGRNLQQVNCPWSWECFSVSLFGRFAKTVQPTLFTCLSANGLLRGDSRFPADWTKFLQPPWLPGGKSFTEDAAGELGKSSGEGFTSFIARVCTPVLDEKLHGVDVELCFNWLWWTTSALLLLDCRAELLFSFGNGFSSDRSIFSNADGGTGALVTGLEFDKASLQTGWGITGCNTMTKIET